MKCLICKKEYAHLGSHLWHGHKIKARDYKMEFGLDLKFPLMDADVKARHRAMWDNKAKRKKMLANLTDKYCFKPGSKNRNYFSRQSTKRALENIKNYQGNKNERCPVCNMTTKHLPSHLFNKHGLVIANKSKLWKT